MEHSFDKINETIASNIENVLQSIIEQIKKLPENKKSDRTKIFVRHLTYLFEHVLARIKTTPIDEKIKRDYYWKLWHNNKSIKEKLIEFTASMEEQRDHYQSTITRNYNNYLRNCQVVKRIENQFTEDAEVIRLRFERKQINEYKQFEERKHDLKEICSMARNKFHNFRSYIKKLEEQTFLKRLKVSSKLLALLQRYDTEIGDRVKTITNLKTQLKILMDRNCQLEDKMEEQSFLHDSCLNEQEEAKFLELKTKLEAISGRIAAIKIQRWWRTIFLSLKTRQKKSKGKGKTKSKKKQ